MIAVSRDGPVLGPLTAVNADLEVQTLVENLHLHSRVKCFLPSQEPDSPCPPCQELQDASCLSRNPLEPLVTKASLQALLLELAKENKIT